MNYLVHLCILISLYFILTLTLNLLVGYAGLLTLCHAAFSGIGAYACTLLIIRADIPFYLALPLAMAFAGLVAFLIAFPALRLRGDYFVLATLGFQIIIYSVIYNCEWLTRGPYGISDIPSPSLWGIRLSSPFAFLILAALLTGFVAVIVWRLVRSPFGRTLCAIRDDELAALSLGKNVHAFLRINFALAATLAAPGGALLAVYNSYLDPAGFTLDESTFILAAVIIGGAGHFLGAAYGAIILIILPEILRLLRISDSFAGSLRQILFGLGLVLIMRWRPKGISGSYTFD